MRIIVIAAEFPAKDAANYLNMSRRDISHRRYIIAKRYHPPKGGYHCDEVALHAGALYFGDALDDGKTVDGGLYVAPEAGRAYIDRRKEFPYKIAEDDPCCRLFISAGFQWGGHWTEKKDYQHFEIGT